MSTEYFLRCAGHEPGTGVDLDDSWPEDGARSFQIPALRAVVEHRETIVKVEQLHPDISITFDMLGAPGRFLARHAGCELELLDEYGQAVAVGGSR
jgi:hypothetical protein